MAVSDGLDGCRAWSHVDECELPEIVIFLKDFLFLLVNLHLNLTLVNNEEGTSQIALPKHVVTSLYAAEGHLFDDGGSLVKAHTEKEEMVFEYA